MQHSKQGQKQRTSGAPKESLNSCQACRDDPGRHDAVEDTGAADAADADGDFLDVAQMEQVRADEWPQHTGDEGDGASLGQGEEDSGRNHRGQDVSLKSPANPHGGA